MQVTPINSPLATLGGTPLAFAWALPNGETSRQAAYELELAQDLDFSSAALVWRSGRVEEGRSQNIAYGGPALSSHTAYHWRVRIYGQDGAISEWSSPQRWETGLLSPQDWQGEMISPLTMAEPNGRSPILRKSFDVDAPAQSARLYITSYGLYRCTINGIRVGADELTPGWTSYTDRLGYQTYDVAQLLLKGRNEIAVTLADGWYRGTLLWPPNQIQNTYGTSLGCIAQLRMIDAKGSVATVVTDTSWRSGKSPVVSSGIYEGEAYDARLEGEETDLAGVDRLEFNKGTLVAQEAQTVQVIGELNPQATRLVANNISYFDFGQNIAGFVRLTVSGERGATIIVDHAEIVDADGELGQASLRSAKAQLSYVLKGEGDETYQPTFTFMGFRHVRVTIRGKAQLKSISARPISSALPVTGTFKCGHALVNRLHENASWSLNGNFIDIPTDCPQRDERLGWCGDAQIFAPTANYLRDCSLFLRKWLRDMVADQREDGAISHTVPNPTRFHEEVLPNFYGSAGWGDAICTVPWTLWTFYGDKTVLAETMPAMQRWVHYLRRYAQDGIVQPALDFKERSFTFGDWLQPTTFAGWVPPNAKPNPNTGDDYMATVFLYVSARITAKSAAVLGNTSVQHEFDRIADDVRTAFQREFITGSGRLAFDSQGALVLALYHDLLPESAVPKAIERLRRAIARTAGHIGTGVMTTPLLLPTLSKVGLHREAIQMLLTETNPSWLYQVKRGATTIWERWDGIDLEGTSSTVMNSYNHYAYGAVAFWFYHHLAGIQPDQAKPGFERLVLAPEFHQELSPLVATFKSRYGEIESRWEINGTEVNYETTVPPGLEAFLKLPAEAGGIQINGVYPSELDRSLLTKDGLRIPAGKNRVRLTLES